MVNFKQFVGGTAKYGIDTPNANKRVKLSRAEQRREREASKQRESENLSAFIFDNLADDIEELRHPQEHEEELTHEEALQRLHEGKRKVYADIGKGKQKAKRVRCWVDSLGLLWAGETLIEHDTTVRLYSVFKCLPERTYV